MTRTAVALALVLAASLAHAGGPPRLLVERAAPGSAAERAGAAYVVHAEQCGQPLDAAIIVRALRVDGQHHDVLKVGLVPTATTGAYLLKPTWRGEGTWVVEMSLDHHGHATLLLRDSPSGAVSSRLLQAPATRKDYCEIAKLQS